MRFRGKTALATGTASGIGLQIAMQFIAEGATVIGTDINEQALTKASATTPYCFWPPRKPATSPG